MAEVNPGRTGLVEWFPLDESSGNRVGAHAGLVLVDNNTVTSATGKVGTAADFERDNSEYLSIADNAALSMGDVDMSVVGWVKFETIAGGGNPAPVLAKFDSNTAGKREYALDWDAATNRFRFYVRNTADSAYGIATATAFGAPTTGVWYFFHGYHDSVANVVGISINASTAATVAHTGGIYDGTSSFRLGFGPFGTTLYADALLDEVAIYKGLVLSADNASWLYNSGNGRSYAETAAAALGLPVIAHYWAEAF